MTEMVLRLPLFEMARPPVIAASGRAPCLVLQRLAEVCALECAAPDAADDPAVTIGRTGSRREFAVAWEPWPQPVFFDSGIFWNPEALRFHVEIDTEYCCWNYLLAVIRRALAFCLLNAMRRIPAVMLHGALLKCPDSGSGTVIFAESGMGKSTCAGRFQRQGGVVLADDKLLLHCRGDKVYAQGLPTWSSWDAQKNGVVYPIAETVEVKRLLRLTRGAVDEIAPMEPLLWKLKLTEGIGACLCQPPTLLPKELIAATVKEAQMHIDHLINRFGANELRATLSGNLYRMLNEIT